MKERISNVLGTASLACSLMFWALIAVEAAVPDRVTVDLTFSQSSMISGGFVLGLAAAYIGSRRWLLAAVLAVFTVVISLIVVFLGEPAQYYAR